MAYIKISPSGEYYFVFNKGKNPYYLVKHKQSSITLSFGKAFVGKKIMLKVEKIHDVFSEYDKSEKRIYINKIKRELNMPSGYKMMSMYEMTIEEIKKLYESINRRNKNENEN